MTDTIIILIKFESITSNRLWPDSEVSDFVDKFCTIIWEVQPIDL